MAATSQSVAALCRKLLGADPSARERSLKQYLDSIPRLSALAGVPSGTPVLVRGDVDAKPGPQVGEGDIRLRSMQETLDYGRAKGWKQIVFGHIGREPEKSLGKVAARLSQILGCPVPLIEDWLDESTMTVKDHVTETIAKAPPGSVFMLENTRRYNIERVLWKAKPADIDGLADKLSKLAPTVAPPKGYPPRT